MLIQQGDVYRLESGLVICVVEPYSSRITSNSVVVLGNKYHEKCSGFWAIYNSDIEKGEKLDESKIETLFENKHTIKFSNVSAKFKEGFLIYEEFGLERSQAKHDSNMGVLVLDVLKEVGESINRNNVPDSARIENYFEDFIIKEVQQWLQNKKNALDNGAK